VLEWLARSNAAQWGTHIRRRNRKCSDALVAVVRSVAAAIRVLTSWPSFDNPFNFTLPRSTTRHRLGIQRYKGQADRQFATLSERAA
jgi:hypothetical protein